VKKEKMDKIVSIILQAKNEQAFKELKILLHKEESSLVKFVNNVDEMLTLLDPNANGVGYIMLLALKLHAQKLDTSKFQDQFILLVNNLSSVQAKIVSSKFAHVCRKFTEIMIDRKSYLFGIQHLRTALKKYGAGSDVLTPIHPLILQLALVGKVYHIGAVLLQNVINDINPDKTGLNSRDILLYYYYGGLIFTGLKQFDSAAKYFRTAIGIPAVVMSAIVAESYKKFVLVSLLAYGKAPNVPRYTSHAVFRSVKTSFGAYTDFGNAYLTRSTDDLHKVAQSHAELFQKDRNFGLVKQCIQSLYRRNIQNLTQTYLTFSLKDIAQNVKLQSPQEAELQVLRMIEKGEIFATINQKDGIVAFQENQEQYDSKQILTVLDKNIQGVILLGNRVRQLDDDIATSVPYVQRTTLFEGKGRGEMMGMDSDRMSFGGNL